MLKAFSISCRAVEPIKEALGQVIKCTFVWKLTFQLIIWWEDNFLNRCIDLKISEITEEIRYVMLFYYKKGKNAALHTEKFWKFTARMLWVNERPRSGLRDSVAKIRMSKTHLVLVGQSLKKSVKFCNWRSRTGKQAVKK